MRPRRLPTKGARYDRAAIMRDAHKRYRDGKRLGLGWTFGRCLSTAWAAAKIRRKAIYEELHPETKAGVAGANARWNATDNLSAAFASATSEATGKDERTIRRAAARGEALGDDLAQIAGTSLDKGVELDALARAA